MSQHALYGPQIGSSLQEMGCKRVPEGMRAYGFFNPCLCGKILDNIKHHHAGQRTAAAQAQEQIGLGTAFYLHVATVRQVVANLLYSPSGNWNQTLFAALARYTDKALLKKKVLHPERAEFRYT